LVNENFGRISSIESKSSHPVAGALVDYARLHFIKPVPENVENFQNFPGEGIFGTIDGRDIYIGNNRVRVRAGCKRGDCIQNLILEGFLIMNI
jgi:Zn2+/Cd2+-exporting ATPase